MVDCPANGGTLYPSQECVLDPSVAFASWCAGRSREESLCAEPTEAATTGGCGNGGSNTTASRYGGVPACRWEESVETISSDGDDSPETGGDSGPRCFSNLDRWLSAASGRR